jgi:hypothetical protein
LPSISAMSGAGGKPGQRAAHRQQAGVQDVQPVDFSTEASTASAARRAGAWAIQHHGGGGDRAAQGATADLGILATSSPLARAGKAVAVIAPRASAAALSARVILRVAGVRLNIRFPFLR